MHPSLCDVGFLCVTILEILIRLLTLSELVITDNILALDSTVSPSLLLVYNWCIVTLSTLEGTPSPSPQICSYCFVLDRLG